MRLWLLRHGEAEPCVTSDSERPLTARGRAEARASAGHLRGVALARVLVSPLLRAQQTAAEVFAVIGYAGPVETVDWITPDSDAQAALKALDHFDGQGDLLLVTHQNFVGELAGLLIHGHRQAPLDMRTGSLAVLEGDALAAGLLRLESLRDPQVG